MIAEEIPGWLQNMVNKVNYQIDIFPAEKKANHVLLNEYKPGQGIMPHLDGSLYYPIVTTVSLKSQTVLNFYEPLKTTENSGKKDRLKFKLLIQPRSLLVLKKKLYENYLHGIEETFEDVIDEKVANCEAEMIGKVLKRDTRVSLTIRNVPKTTKFKFKI